jgi:hypothetical protein
LYEFEKKGCKNLIAITRAKKFIFSQANNTNFESLSTFANQHATAIEKIISRPLHVSENLAIEIEKMKTSDEDLLNLPVEIVLQALKFYNKSEWSLEEYSINCRNHNCKDSNYNLFAKLFLGDSNLGYKIRQFLYFMLECFYKMNQTSEWFAFEALREKEDRDDKENHMYQFCEDIIDATEHLEKTVTTTEFESMHLLKVGNQPKLIAQKHDIVQSLEYLREFQFNDNFTCGTFEIRILATIFNCEFLLLSIEQAENKTVQLKLKKETLKPYSFMKEYVDTSKLPAVKIVLFCEHNEKYFILNKDTGPIELTNTINESLIPKVTVKMWLENRSQKSVTDYQLNENN